MLEFKCARTGNAVRVNPADVASVQEDEWLIRASDPPQMKKVLWINFREGKGRQQVILDAKRDSALKVFNANPG